MTNELKPASITVEFCYHKEEDGSNCSFSPKWAISSTKTAFRVCDKHLAWGIRLSGAPAQVEEYKKRDEEDTQPIKYEPDLMESERRTHKKTTQLTVMKNPATMKREEEGGRTRISERPFAKKDEKH